MICVSIRFFFFVSLQIVAAWMINDFTKWHINAVNKARMMNLTLASVEKDEEKHNTRPRWEGVYVGAPKSE